MKKFGSGSLQFVASFGILFVGMPCTFSGAAFGDNGSEVGIFSLPTDAQSLVPLKSELLSVESLCPPGVMCATNGTVITLKYLLPGCVDVLAPVRAKAVPASNNTLDVYVSAQAVVRAASEVTRCFAPNRGTFKLTLISQVYEKNEVRIVDIGL